MLQHTIQHHSLKRLVITNNGNPFGPTDWTRLTKIAEGNPDETKIGAFGVGFYSVFADCEEPLVSSGSEALAFYWKGNALYTRRLKLSPEQSSNDTNFVLDYRNSSSPIPPLLPLCEFLASSLTFVGLETIELWLDDSRLLSLNKLSAPKSRVPIPKGLHTKTSEGIMNVESVEREVAELNATWLKIVFWNAKATAENHSTSSSKVSANQSLRTFFGKFGVGSANAAAEKAAKEERMVQEAIADNLLGESTATVFLHSNTASIRTLCGKQFAQELERATKKPPPKLTKIAILTSSYDGSIASTNVLPPANGLKVKDVFSTVLPGKSGRIYIGFPTHQTTGLSAHISAQSVIPTVERESIDLNARWVRTWNQEMLRAAGIVCRIAWAGEIESIKDKLDRTLTKRENRKLSSEDILSVMPETVHLLKQFTFQESTPSSNVGSLVEDAFWTSSRDASIDILSSRGILPIRDIRLATDDLSFVDRIPVLPPELITGANGFFKKLTEYGLISEITTSDIKSALESQALNSKELVEFLKWLGRKARIQDVDASTVKALFGVTVVNDDDPNAANGGLIEMHTIKNFVNPFKIPGNVPVPPDTIPFKFTREIETLDLEALGLRDLQIVPWLRWLVESAEKKELSIDHDLTQAAPFSALVLPVISKQWKGLGQGSKSSVIGLLASRTVIPTKMGMKKPRDAYFASVKLFDDLPIVSNLNAVKADVLASLGVRKTIELNLIFERLMRPPEYQADASAVKATWSHADLVKYLASVRSDIPPDDIIRLKSTPLCPAEADGPNRATMQRFLLAELFEPSEVLRSLGLQLLQWPGPYRNTSNEGQFLTFLGLRKYPSVSELTSIMTKAIASDDYALRDRALKYFIDFHHSNGYSNLDAKSLKVPFLPVDGDMKSIATPGGCVTNVGAMVMGYKILRPDLHPHVPKLGVKNDPEIQDCVHRLIERPPKRNKEAREIFRYMATRLDKITALESTTLGQAKIVPVFKAGSINRPTSEKDSAYTLVVPRLCFLGIEQKYKELFDYVDFGPEANAFLLRCGATHEPSSLQLGKLVVQEPASILKRLESVDKYLELLRTLAGAWPTLKKDRMLASDMKSAAFLLAYKEHPSKTSKAPLRAKHDEDEEIDEEDDAGIRTYQLVRSSQIVIVDDIINYNLFKSELLAAPLEEPLESFYESLGAKSLRGIVKQQTQIGRMLENQHEAERMKRVVNERIKLFLHEIPKEKVRRNAFWVEKNLDFVAVQNIIVTSSLEGLKATHKSNKGAAVMEDVRKGWTLQFVPSRNDYFDISTAVVQLLLNKSKPQEAMMLDMLLSTDLQKLRQRGYNIDRILQRRAAEKRIEEAQRQQQLEKEQQLLKEQEANAQNNDSQLDTILTTHPPSSPGSMPGIFPESQHSTPEQNLSLSLPGNTNLNPPPRRRGILGELTRRLGIDDRRHSHEDRSPRTSTEENSLIQPPPPPYIQDNQSQAPGDGRAIVSPSKLTQDLRNAIKASRAHNSNSVFSPPTQNNVQETKSYCDATPGQNIAYHSSTSSGIKIFLSCSLPNKSTFMSANGSALESFAGILKTCAEVFGLNNNAVHIFQDPGSKTIAFNTQGSVFCNYSYFENLHVAEVLAGRRGDAVVYWFVVLCHELAHNLVGDHSSGHSYYT